MSEEKSTAVTTCESPTTTTRQSTPAVDLLEFEDHVELRFDLPGVNRDQVDLRYEQGQLTVRAERTTAEDGWFHQEFGSSLFSRTFAVPTEFDASRIDARTKNGVLTVSIPKDESAKVRRIDVR